VKQLKDYKAGKDRPNAIMAAFAGMMTEEDMINVAAYLEKQTPGLGTAKNKASIELGQKIYRGGIPSKQVAACAACHSPNGAGIPSQYPRLSGQWAEYTEAQLVAYRQGERKNSVQMTGIASRMSDAEIKAVSDYIAGLR
jgi:cytochrome c553